MTTAVSLPEGALKAFCERHRVRRLSLFGSVLRDDFGPDSDIDVLVEFEPDAVVGFLGMAQMEIELAELVGRKVDIRTPAELSPYIRDKVLAAAETRYDRG